MGGGAKYPADVAAALEHAAEEGWPIECYQAVLAIALGHLEIQVRPEVVVQYTEEEITYRAPGLRRQEDGVGFEWGEVERHLSADTVYLVCPVCVTLTPGHWVGEALETASVDIELDALGTLTAWREDYDTTSEGSDKSYLVCQNRDCYAELDIPAWLTFDD